MIIRILIEKIDGKNKWIDYILQHKKNQNFKQVVVLVIENIIEFEKVIGKNSLAIKK